MNDTENTDANSSDDIQSILAIEENASNQSKQPLNNIQQKVSDNSFASRKDNLYVDQQLKPGQVVGYGIPTDQKVEIPIAKGKSGLSKKAKRRILFIIIALFCLAALGGITVLALSIAKSK